MRHCGTCHECGAPLKACLDGEEWCPRCQEYKRYRSHGWPVPGDLECGIVLGQVVLRPGALPVKGA